MSVGKIHTVPSYSSIPISEVDLQDRRKIVVALDDSSYSKYAFEWAIDHLIQPEKDVVILTSIAIVQDASDYLSALTESTPERDARLKARGEEYAKKILDDVAAIIRKHAEKLGSKAKIIHEIFTLGVGDARSILVDFCKTNKAEMLVMGHRGRGMISKARALMGSVSDYCVQNASCPVLIVRNMHIDRHEE